jgi:drug/metabolite transporter superfamily protein YnfA
MQTRASRYIAAMALLTGLFALRIAAQAVQFWIPQSVLPTFDAFQGSSLSYSTLLLTQLLIFALMLRTCLRIGFGISVPDRRFGRGLAWFGGIYMAGSIIRIAVGIAAPSAPAWFSTWIPAFFHLVLAGFVLTAADFHLRGSRPAHGTAEQ